VHQLVNKKNFDNIKTHGTTVKKRKQNAQGCIWLLVPTVYEIKVLHMVSKRYNIFNMCTVVVVTAGIEAEVKKAFQEKHETFGSFHVFQ